MADSELMTGGRVLSARRRANPVDANEGAVETGVPPEGEWQAPLLLAQATESAQTGLPAVPAGSAETSPPHHVPVANNASGVRDFALAGLALGGLGVIAWAVDEQRKEPAKRGCDGDDNATRIALSDIAAGRRGLVIDGAVAGERAGWTLAGGGDFNGDGLADIALGAPFADSAEAAGGGRVYVVFGRTSGAVVLSKIAAGEGGFVLDGLAVNDRLGRALVMPGDLNGDGLADLVVGAPFADPDGRDNAGATYVVFGRSGGAAPKLSAVAAGQGGFAIAGAAAGDYSGFSLAGGDFNGDGWRDVLLGAYGRNSNSGGAYVVFGRTAAGAVDLAAPFGGFSINGARGGDYAGESVASLGDVNGDGFAELAIGAAWSDPPAGRDAGRAYVVFGRTADTAIDLAEAASATLAGTRDGEGIGGLVLGVGDLNGDGRGDLALGSGVEGSAGKLYVLFGSAALAGGEAPDLTAVAAGQGGFVVDGSGVFDDGGLTAAPVGDLNRDGLADLLIGSPSADPAAGSNAGRAFVVFGKTGGEVVALSALADGSGSGGFAIDGEQAGTWAGRTVQAAGDFNGDGFQDLLIGAPYGDSATDPASADNAGRVYLVFGRAGGPFAPVSRSALLPDYTQLLDGDASPDAGATALSVGNAEVLRQLAEGWITNASQPAL